MSFQCKSCSETHLFDTFQGCPQHKSPKIPSEFPGDWVRSATPTGWEEGSSKISDTPPPTKDPKIEPGEFFRIYQISQTHVSII